MTFGLCALLFTEPFTKSREIEMRTFCDGCGKPITLDIWDADGVLVGAECKCGYYVTRYTPEFDEDKDF